MSGRMKNIFSPMWRTIWIALAGQGFFIFSVITMSPLRMWDEPVVNYNLFYLPILIFILGFLFYRCCTEEQESRAFLYGFFAALLAWPVIGEMSSLPVEKGIITQFSDIDIKGIGGWYFVAFGWVALKILWRTGAMKRSVCVFMMTFLSIWTFELYMDNYSSSIPIDMMPLIGNIVAAVSAVVMIAILIIARKTPSLEQKTVLGIILYIFFSLLLMGADQWKKPSKFYATYEAAHISSEIRELTAEQEKIEQLKLYMLSHGLLDGKSIKYLADRGLITTAAVTGAVEQGALKAKDLIYIIDKNLVAPDLVKSAAAKGLARALQKGTIKEKDLHELKSKGVIPKD